MSNAIVPPYRPESWQQLTFIQKNRLGLRLVERRRLLVGAGELRAQQADPQGIFLMFDRALELLGRSKLGLRDSYHEITSAEILGYPLETNEVVKISMNDVDLLSWYLKNYIETNPDQAEQLKNDWKYYHNYLEERVSSADAYSMITQATRVSRLAEALNLARVGMGMIYIEEVNMDRIYGQIAQLSVEKNSLIAERDAAKVEVAAIRIQIQAEREAAKIELEEEKSIGKSNQAIVTQLSTDLRKLVDKVARLEEQNNALALQKPQTNRGSNFYEMSAFIAIQVGLVAAKILYK